MAGVSSLLKNAAATRTRLQKEAEAAAKEIKTQEDSLAAFQWENSAQTYEDYVSYSSYLQDRADKETDFSSQMTYANKLRSAARSYTSNEIQRSQMALMEGRGTTQDKMQAVQSLYEQAIQNGDMNLAQNLVSQWDTLSVKLQNEQDAQQRLYNSMAMNGVKSVKQLVNNILDNKLGQQYIQLPDGNVVKPLNVLSGEFSAAGTTQSGNVFKEAADSLAAIQQLVVDAYNGAGTQEAADAILTELGGYVDGTKKVKLLGQEFTPDELHLAASSAEANNPLYSITSKRNEATGQEEFGLKKNKVEDFVWARTGTDPVTGQDNYSPVNVRTSQDNIYNQNLNTKFTDEGYVISNTDSKKFGKDTGYRIGTGDYVAGGSTVSDRLASMGIQASTNEDGTINITVPGSGTYQATIGNDGTIRFYGAPGQYSGGNPGLYEFSLFDRPDFGVDPTTGKKYSVPSGIQGLREVAPDETSIFGTASKFGGLLSQPSAAGNRITNIYNGSTQSFNAPLGPMARITGNRPDISGASVPVGGSALQGSTQLLDNARTTSLAIQAKQAEAAKQAALQAEATRLQSAPVFNFNQTPIQQIAQNGAPIRQLTVAKPAPTPNVRVAAPTPTPNVRVGVANPGNVTVGVARPGNIIVR